MVISRAEHDAERVELPRFGGGDLLGDCGPGALAFGAIGIEIVLEKLIAQSAVILDRLVNGAQMHRTALLLVRREQAVAAPALQDARELPAEIDAVGNAEIHAVAAKWRMQMTGVAGEKHAAVAVTVGDQASAGRWLRVRGGSLRRR